MKIAVLLISSLCPVFHSFYVSRRIIYCIVEIEEAFTHKIGSCRKIFESLRLSINEFYLHNVLIKIFEVIGQEPPEQK